MVMILFQDVQVVIITLFFICRHNGISFYMFCEVQGIFSDIFIFMGSITFLYIVLQIIFYTWKWDE